LAFLSAVAILDSRCCHAFSSPLGIQSTRSKSYDASDASCPIWGERRVTKQGIFSRRCIVLEADQDDQSSSTNQDTFFYSPNIELDETRYRYDLGEADGEVADESSNTVGGENEFSFFDEAIIYVRAGSGGQGSSTYKKGVGRQDAQPDGGSGGKGGDVILVVDDSLNTLAGLTNAWRPNRFGGGGGAAVVSTSSQSFRAENGQDGGRMFKNAKFGGDAIIRVPPGTVIQQAIDIKEDDGNITTTWVEIGSVGVNDDVEPGVGAMETLVVALGGEGGEGSGSVKKVGRGVKRVRSPPVGGERKRLKLTLKIVADVALVGVPNTGKSTFLAAVTRAKPKIANVRFHLDPSLQ
jgi:Obg family GTPase CgtA